MTRRQLSLAQRALREWGDLSLFKDMGLRHLVAESIAARLALSPEFVRDRLDQFHRIANYEESRSSSGE